MAKTLVIGWDAADWQLIHPLIKRGLMPTLKTLIQGGVHGNIATLQPALSPILWTSIATGKRAYHHGVHGFVQVNPATANIEPIGVKQRNCKAIWNILNETGERTNVVNWWPSHPAEKVNGVYVSNRFHYAAPPFGQIWPMQKGVVWPLSWEDKLAELRVHPAELTLAHVIPFIKEAANLNPEKDPVLKPLMRVLAHTCSVHNAATELMAKTEWSFMAVYQESIDHFSHLAMKYHPPQLKGVDDKAFALYQNIITAAYRFHDMMLARLLELAGSQTNVLLLSDHGFYSDHKRVVNLPNIPAAPALEHRNFGVLVANGPAFKQKEQVFGASLLDITPTLLHLHNLPVGDDMEGKVLTQLFKQKDTVGYIESWEKTSVQVEFLEGEQEAPAQDEVLQQLEEIGYVSLPEKEKQAYVKRELTYNLIQSFVDGKKWKEALKEANVFFEQNQDVRAAKLLLHISDAQQEAAFYSKGLSYLSKHLGIQHPDVQFFLGVACLQKGDYKKALKHFIPLEDAGALSTQLYSKIAQAFYLSSKFETALHYTNKALELEAENPLVLSLKGNCLQALNRVSEAITCYVESIGLQYFQPTVHFEVAKLWLHLNKVEEAKTALQVCLAQAPKHKSARAMLASLSTTKMKKALPVTVISGLPRSGTSMLMQMLVAGGVNVLTDKKRQGDIHNPNGYYELEKVKDLPQNNSWVEEAQGKAIKVVSPLLAFLPQHLQYYVIRIKRPLLEVLISQEKMKGKKQEDVVGDFPFKLALDFEAEEKRLEAWLEKQPNIHVLNVLYKDCIEHPTEVANRINSFLPYTLQVDKAASAINASLYRNKLV